jgi:ABC-2 type transport system permease protein
MSTVEAQRPGWAPGTTLTQVAAVAGRSIRRTARQPAMAIPPLIFPVALMLVNAAGLEPSTLLPGFPTDSFLAFALAVPFIQGALFSTMNGGTDLARDIQTGFLNRLSLTSMRGIALIAGQLAGVVVLGLVQAAFYIAVGLIVGVDFAAGALGILVLFGFAAVISVGFGALGVFLALRTGSGEAIQGLFPLLFVFLFLSSMNAPRDLIDVDWFRFVASVNPVSYLIECVRSLIITGWDGDALALGFGFAVLIGMTSVMAASLSLKQRLERT